MPNARTAANLQDRGHELLPSPAEALEDLRHSLASRLASGFQRQKEGIILGAIEKRIGSVPIESLRGRLTKVVMQESGIEEWFLDGALLIGMLPEKHELDGSQYSVSQEYYTP